MRLKEFLRAQAERLSTCSDTALLDVKVIVKACLQCDDAFLFRESDYQLTTEQLNQCEQMLMHRLNGVPVAYIVSQQAFWTFDLTVTPDTLIPRPDSECMLEYIQTYLNRNKKVSILDLGTGSGALIIALRSMSATWQCTAIDKSTAALKVASANAARYGFQDIEFIESNWFDALSTSRRFDLIMCNPPYIAADDPALTQLKFEPHTALVAAEDGFADYQHILMKARQYLKSGGMMVFEHGAGQQTELSRRCIENHFNIIHKGKDLAGLPRFLVIN